MCLRAGDRGVSVEGLAGAANEGGAQGAAATKDGGKGEKSYNCGYLVMEKEFESTPAALVEAVTDERIEARESIVRESRLASPSRENQSMRLAGPSRAFLGPRVRTERLASQNGEAHELEPRGSRVRTERLASQNREALGSERRGSESQLDGRCLYMTAAS